MAIITGALPPSLSSSEAALPFLLHDLRQPIQAAMLYEGMLANRMLSPHEKVLLDRLRASLRAAGHVLDTARLALSADRPSLGPVRVGPLLEALVRELQAEADLHRIRLRTVTTRTVVTSDVTMLTRVLRNLMLNALVHSGGRNVVAGIRRRNSGAVHLIIADDGRGISADDMSKLFRLGCHVGATGGSGLGLAGTAWAADRLGHTIFARSELGRGSVFGISIPGGD